MHLTWHSPRARNVRSVTKIKGVIHRRRRSFFEVCSIIFHFAALGDACLEVLAFGFRCSTRLASRDWDRMSLDGHRPTLLCKLSASGRRRMGHRKYTAKASAINAIKLFASFVIDRYLQSILAAAIKPIILMVYLDFN